MSLNEYALGSYVGPYEPEEEDELARFRAKHPEATGGYILTRSDDEDRDHTVETRFFLDTQVDAADEAFYEMTVEHPEAHEIQLSGFCLGEDGEWGGYGDERSIHMNYPPGKYWWDVTVRFSHDEE